MAGELAAEWIKIPDGNGNLQKVWVRDSTARRDIAQLQTDVSGKADAATTLAGYGITDAYTKTQVDGMIPSVPSAYTSNPAMDGTASPGSSTAWARGDHVHPHDSTKADASAIPTKTSDLTNDSGFITSSDVPDPSSAAPVMDGTASAGSSTDYARADHVHPSDTSKQDAATTGTLTFNNTSYNQTYMDSASGKWERIGNIVVFNLTYKMRSSISSHLTSAILGFPNCPITAHFLSESSVSDVAARHVTVSGDKGTIAGAHSGGVTYYVAGAYLTE